MNKYNLDHEDDATLRKSLPEAVSQHREIRARVLEHLAEATRRGLKLPSDTALQIRGMLEDMIEEL